MHKSQPNRRSEASPRMCALECQKTFLPSGSSKSRNSNWQLFSSGRSRSHSVSFSVPLSKRAITVRSNKLLAIPLAMSAGLVTHDCPTITFPSGSVILICSYYWNHMLVECIRCNGKVWSYRGVSGQLPRRTSPLASHCRF